MCPGDLGVVPRSKYQKGIYSFRGFPFCLPIRFPLPGEEMGPQEGRTVSRGRARRAHPFQNPLLLSRLARFWKTLCIAERKGFRSCQRATPRFHCVACQGFSRSGITVREVGPHPCLELLAVLCAQSVGPGSGHSAALPGQRSPGVGHGSEREQEEAGSNFLPGGFVGPRKQKENLAQNPTHWAEQLRAGRGGASGA